ncbi:hypothetical protein QVD17_30541 [Tagetes erecta]|uniref:Uncharacterized protein n=1 Tax=Tagetes erecta TaxID=13708 RepID=A0AAD8NN17_TARER|nr:hypothetical protein QVD17_30541 [Tagetes erecta]
MSYEIASGVIVTGRPYNYAREIMKRLRYNIEPGKGRTYKFMMFPIFLQLVIDDHLPDVPKNSIRLIQSKLRAHVFENVKSNVYGGQKIALFANMLNDEVEVETSSDESEDLKEEDNDDSDDENVEGRINLNDEYQEDNDPQVNGEEDVENEEEVEDNMENDQDSLKKHSNQASTILSIKQAKTSLDDFIIHLNRQNPHLPSVIDETDEDLKLQAKEITKLKEKLEESEASLRRENEIRVEDAEHEQFVLEE